MFRILAVFIGIFISSSLFANTLAGKVIKITDGDTVHVLLDDHSKEKIRLAGIDAPERGQPHGTKAKQYLSSLIGS